MVRRPYLRVVMMQVTCGACALQALILHSQDWAFFSAWSNFADLAAQAGAEALLIVNPEEAVYTLQDVKNYTAPVPVWNMDCNCGATLSYFASQGTPDYTCCITPCGL